MVYKPTGELGRVKEVRAGSEFVWVVYGPEDKDWDNFEAYTGMATRPCDLEAELA
ncbi:MAG TPA: hypothetical protein VH164_13365 [Ktedonobacteraceae bacterium]|nr:hypothetical protein [Ktedonobacteraceae bacterium]